MRTKNTENWIVHYRTKLARPTMATLVVLTGLSSLATTSLAGGFNLGEANTDILFSKGKNSLSVGYVHGFVDRPYETIEGAAGTDGSYLEDLGFANFAYKRQLTDNIACALTYAQPFGRKQVLGPQAQGAALANVPVPPAPFASTAVKRELKVHELGATCSNAFALGAGKLHVLGGAYWQNTEVKIDSVFSNPLALGAVQNFGELSVEDKWAPGYRLGVAYELPEIALRVQLMYRSEVKHDTSGQLTTTPQAQALGLLPTHSATSTATLPQSFKLSAQTGVAPNWLVFGSLSWTEWSKLQSLDVNINGLGLNQSVFNYKDGWTAKLGVGHQFTDKLIGTASVTWDQGVGTGADISSDIWSMQLGAQYDTGGGKIGGAVTFARVTEGSQSLSEQSAFNATAGKDWAVGLGVNYSLDF